MPNCIVRKLWTLNKLMEIVKPIPRYIRKLLFSYQKVKSITLPLIQDKEESAIKWVTIQRNAFAHVIISLENEANSVILNSVARLSCTRNVR